MKTLNKFVIVMLLVTLIGSIVGTNPRTVQADGTPTLKPCQLGIGLTDPKPQVDAKCGSLSVPEDYTKPDGRKLDIHFMIIPAAKAATQKPIFFFDGGPGGAAIADFGESWYGVFDTLLPDHDIVLIDQRGTGTSTSLQCTELTSEAFNDLAKNLSAADAKKSDLDRLTACYKRLSATTDPATYISDNLADDTDAVRAALGYDQIDLFGNSYGTWLGQYYLKRHGDHVHGVVLDSTLGPWNLADLQAADNAQASLDKIFALCSADALCDQKYPDLTGQLQTVLDNLAKNPVTVSAASQTTNKEYSVVITKGRFIDTLHQILYDGSSLSLIPMIISQASLGIYTLVAGIEVEITEQFNTISIGLYYSVTCAEAVAFYTPDQISSAFHGSIFDDPDQLSVDQCKVWRSAELDPADVAPVQSDRPVLVLEGNFDPITPVIYGEETNKRLPNSTLAVFPYQSHGVMVGSRCAENMVAAYFAAPTNTVDTSCAANDLKPIFGGAYDVNFTPYSDPNGAFTTRIPKGWIVDSSVPAGTMTFFTSPDEYKQLLGVGVYKNTNVADAQKKALDFIQKNYGPTTIQAQTSASAIIFTINIAIETTIRPDEVYYGMLMMRQTGGNTMVIWQAAPRNIFGATSIAVIPYVFAGTNPR